MWGGLASAMPVSQSASWLTLTPGCQVIYVPRFLTPRLAASLLGLGRRQIGSLVVFCSSIAVLPGSQKNERNGYSEQLEPGRMNMNLALSLAG
jgi:hypothetical protein